MQLTSTTKSESPLSADHLRISAEIRFDRDHPRTVWIDVPRQYGAIINDRGEPWVVLLLPCAAVTGEDIRLELPVDPILLYNLTGVQRVWQSWYPWIKPVRIEAPERPDPDAGTDTALFFGGGVDSHFSLLGVHPQADIAGVPRPSSLLAVWGFDIPLSKPDEFARARELAQRAADHFQKELIAIATNLRDLPGFRDEWGELGHGAALASIGHLLSKRFGHILIGSTHNYSHLSPWGSHPLVDPQFSSAKTSIIHDGAPSTRVEKVERVCDFPEAAKALRVCWALKGASNCCRCGKCLRTMAMLDLLDKQKLAESFDWTDYSLERVARMFLRDSNDVDTSLEIREAAEARGRADIVRAIDRALRRSRRLRLVRAMSRPVLSALKKNPFLWRQVDPLRRSLIGPGPPKRRTRAESAS